MISKRREPMRVVGNKVVKTRPKLMKTKTALMPSEISPRARQIVCNVTTTLARWRAPGDGEDVCAALMCVLSGEIALFDCAMRDEFLATVPNALKELVAANVQVNQRQIA
jgi:hypothetical protein